MHCLKRRIGRTDRTCLCYNLNMKYMKQIAIIFAVSCAGEILHYFIPLPVPASIYGLVLIFALLCTRVVKPADVKDGAGFLISIMPMMFIPLAAGLLDSFDVVRPVLIPVCVITVVSTVLVFGVTGVSAQAMIRRGADNGKEDRHE